MKNYLLKLSFFLVIISLTLGIIHQFQPYYWGNKKLAEKLDYFEKVAPGFNTVFFGSSRIHKHVVPKIFDNQVGNNFKSFNLGSGGTFYYEMFYTVNNFIDSESCNEIENIFIENQFPTTIPKSNLHSTRSKYFFSKNNIGYALKYFGDFEQKKFHLLSYIENLLLIGELKDVIKFHSKSLKLPKAKERNNGFSSYTIRDEDKPGRKKYKRQLKSGERASVINEEERLEYIKITKNRLRNKAIYDQSLRELIAKCETKSINLYIIYLPYDDYYKEFNYENNVPILFKEFFDEKYTYFQNHLNEKGAKILSKRLGRKFKNLFYKE